MTTIKSFNKETLKNSTLFFLLFFVLAFTSCSSNEELPDERLVEKELYDQAQKRLKDGNYSSFHLYVIRLKLDKLKKNYKTVFNELRKHKINVNLHYLPVHLHPFYKKMGFKQGDFPVSEIYAKEAISIPIYFDLTFDKQKYVAKILKKILK